ncbi:hypothetical protein ONE63_005027 [Megalurothrips usitatus]|uniref:Uncharacterized protein n=1 Tax=Megalurothrips usitatus TaxID=439358 RepID=A0AAV7X823_9NEOP|nr:hypothetical protein ONE63_005027 [Megalurothrips usitatus]
MDPSEIDDVVLVGGSTKMNCIINMLRRVFPGKTISRAINPDEAVAVGAAHMAAIINNDSGAFLDGLRVDNVTPLSIGVEVFRGVFHVVIPKNSVVPVRVGKLYKTGYDNQSEVPFTVYQGERALVKKNKLIGTFLLKDLPASPAGLGLMTMLAIDEDGILAVEARVLPDGQYRGCKLQLTDQSNTEILSKLEDAARYREEDQKEVERLKARYELEQHLAIAKEKVSANIISLTCVSV